MRLGSCEMQRGDAAGASGRVGELLDEAGSCEIGPYSRGIRDVTGD